MKRKLWKRLLLIGTAVLTFALLPFPVFADMGPKPSVRIAFENFGDGPIYGTLLSKDPTTGPDSVWDGKEEHIYNPEKIDLEIWMKFAEYQDSDGFYFLQPVWDISREGKLAWTYYPPECFKILLYDPQTQTFLTSDVCEQYALDSYYTVDVAGAKDGILPEVRNTYQWQAETFSLVIRILLTVAVEMGLAYLIGFRGKKELLFLAAVNAATQIVLNVLLNLLNFKSGSSAFITGYIGLEFLVFAIEAALYATCLRRMSDSPRSTRFYLLYALGANALSFAAGMFLSVLVPGIF